MVEVIWRRKALDDLDGITLYIQQFDPTAARRVRTRISDLGDSLIHYPRRGRPTEHGVRELTTAPPYITSYTLAGDVVTILSIRHGARNTD